MNKAKVYFVREITPESLVKVYQALGRKLPGRVGVKVSTGEAGNVNHLQPSLIAPLVQQLGANIIECNTAYKGKRNTVEDHMRVAEEHGFTKIAEVDIMDPDNAEFEIPVRIAAAAANAQHPEETPDAKGEVSGNHLEVDIVGEHLKNYDSMLNLAHFKGHAMGGFGGVLKNQSIGVASRNGKAYIHGAGTTRNPGYVWLHLPAQDDFLESMAEAAKAVADYLGPENILYINVMNNLSVDCDCDGHGEKPCMADVGIMASTDPVAVDQAAIDMIWSSDDPGRDHFIERVERQHGRHILPYAEQIGLGTREYELIEL